MMKKVSYVLLFLAILIIGVIFTNNILFHFQETQAPEVFNEQEVLRQKGKDTETSIVIQQDVEDNNDVYSEILTFVDVFGEEYQAEIQRNVPKTNYKKEKFVHDGQNLIYDDENYFSRLGVDVSHHQGYIDWEKVKFAGYDFAFIRLGYRGYGKTGSINLDSTFDENLKNAQKAGIEVGVYFFAQAINENEAREEAEFVIKHLDGYTIELPVVYDPESILDAEARTDNVSGEQFTQNALLFCSLIEEAGYKPMIYSNMLWEAFQFDMEKVSDYPFWYADYEPMPQTPYDYIFWQYSNKGNVDGISGRVDLNIELIKKNE